MRRLILLNGPPASGKSTLAARFVESRPLALNLDIDLVRRLLGGWAEHSADAGLLARQLAIAMARTVLEAGRDVIVPQLVARPEFVGALDALAHETGARFVEVALTASKEDMRQWFAARSIAPTTDAHRDADLLVDRLGGVTALDQIHDDLVQFVASRPRTRELPARRSDVEGTLRALEGLVADEVAEEHAGSVGQGLAGQDAVS